MGCTLCLFSSVQRLLLVTLSVAGISGLTFAQEAPRAPAGVGGLSGGGSLTLQVDDCISPAEREHAERAVRQYLERKAARAKASNLPPPLFTFWPMGGRLFHDLFTMNYVDLGPGTSILDWDCTNHSYDTHKGNDTDLMSFGEQAIGVPVFAALDGVVISTHDGEPDMNTSCAGLGNSAIIDHGNGRIAYYWHFKTLSVAISAGQTVKAGQQIGLTGSSGCSTGPHLHYEIVDSGIVTEPYTGTCNPGASQWTDQTPIRRDLYIRDFGITHLNMHLEPWLPFALPRSAQIELSDTISYYWVRMHNVPAFSSWQWHFIRPNGTIAFIDSGIFNISVLFRSGWWFFDWNIADMHTIPGTWTGRFWVNGTLMLEAPIEVVATRDPNFNRPPNPISVALDPSAPTTDDVIQCRVMSSLFMDDLDWDIVRYQYTWMINGSVVRNVTTAGKSDAIPRQLAQTCDLVEVVVTASDGKESAAPVLVSVIVGAPGDTDDNNNGIPDSCEISCVGDFIGAGGLPDGQVNVTDLLALLAAWGPCAAPCPPDINTDGNVNVTDLLALLGAWGACP